MIAGEGSAKVWLASPDELASGVEAYKRHTLLDSQALSEARLPICTGRVGFVSSANTPGDRTAWDANPYCSYGQHGDSVSRDRSSPHFVPRLLGRPMTAGLDTELKRFAELAKESQLKEIY